MHESSPPNPTVTAAAEASATDPARELAAATVERGRWRGAFAGVLAAGAALGAGELLAGISARTASLVVRVGDAVIDNVPGSIERWAIETLGENDKPALVIGIVVISLLIGAATGLAAWRRFGIARAVFAGFALVGALATLGDDQHSAWRGWLAAGVAAIVGLASLRFLLRVAGAPSVAPDDSFRLTPSQSPQRRSFVGAAGAVAAFGVAAPGIGAILRDRQAAGIEADRTAVADALDNAAEVTPAAASESAAAPTASERAGRLTTAANFDDVDGIASLVTPADDFYRIDAALAIPRIDVDTWSMKITGLVDTELEFTFDDLLAMDLEEHFVTLSCVSNQVGGDLVGNAQWLGVPLRTLLDRAGVQSDAVQIVGRSVDGWTGAFPVAYLDDPNRVALVAVAMNGEPLPVRHGFPVRLVIAGLYGYVSATKWLKEIELTTANFDGYWITRGWSREGPIKTQSRIDVPASNATLNAGSTPIAGVAWAPDRGIDKVEVQVSAIVDGAEEPGPWAVAELSEELAETAWRQWFLPWEATPGIYTLRVRATDSLGDTQTSEITDPAPDGATGHHAIAVRIT